MSRPEIRPEAPPRGRAWWLWLALALGVNALLLAAFHDRSWWAPDEGAYADVAARILDGQVLNREVHDLHAGHINFLNALALWIWGRSLLALRYPLVVAALLQTVAVFLLLARRGPPLAAVGAVAATALGVLQFLNPTAHWYCLMLFFVTAWVVVALPRAHPWRLPLLGFLLATQFLFRQLSGVLLAIGVLAWLLLEAEGEDRGAGEGRGDGWLPRLLFLVMAGGLAVYLLRWTNLSGLLLFGIWPLAVLILGPWQVRLGNRETGRLLFPLVAGAAAGALPLLAYHLAHGSLGGWFEDAVLAANAQAHSAFIAERTFTAWILAGFEQALGAGSLRQLASGLFWALAPLAGLLLGVLTLLGARRRRSLTALGALPFLALFHGVVSLHHQIPIYLFYTLPATLAGLFWLAGRAGGGWRSRQWGAGLAVGALAATGLACYAGQPWSRGWSDILAGRTVPLVEAVGIPRCGLRIPRQDLNDYRSLLAVIAAETAPGEPIFALPMQPELYFLSDRPNPTRFFNFAISVRDEAAAREVLATLAAKRPRLVFYNPADKYTTPEVEAFVATLLAPDGPLPYEAVGKVGQLEVLRWKEP